MSYLLLLALVLVAGFSCIQASLPMSKRSPSQTFLLFGLVFIAIGLASELVLGFALDETAAKIFYWVRGSLVLAWLGQSLLLFHFPNDPRMRWLSMAIVVASVGLLVLVFLSHITAAVDWYSPAKPIYGQIHDLLATNRPTRWGSLALNLYGLLILVAGPVYLLFSKPLKRKLSHRGPPLLIAFGAIMLFSPLYLTSSIPNFSFYLVELFGPVFIFIGLENLTSLSFKPSGKTR